VKNFFFLAFVAITLPSVILAREALVPDPSVLVETGHIENSTLIASPGGEIFIEFSNETNFVHETGLVSFSGEILSPAIIELPDKKPRLRMDALISFELISDSGEPVLFADRFDLQNTRNRLREKYLNPETTTRSAWVKLIIPIEDETIIEPQLWEYIGPDDGWATVGGILDEPSPEGVRVFSAILRRTGVYTVFDENPIPKHFADEFDFSQNESSLVGSEDELFWDETNGELPEGITWEDLQTLTFDGEIKAQDQYLNDLPESEISVNDRAITTDEKVALEARRTQLISQLSRATDPTDISLLKEYLSLIERKILIADQREQLIDRQSQLTAAIPKANTEKLRSDLTDQLAMVDAQLQNLKDVELEKRIQEIETSLHMSLSEEVTITPPEEPLPELEIPKEAELPQSGAAGEENTFSLFFPFALLFVVILIIASGIVASKRRL
jgi:hypothetical protein